MRRNKDIPHIRIEPSQELLARALLSDDDSAYIYCHEWLKQADLDNIDPGSYRLMPMLYKRLEKLEISDIDSDTMGRLKGIYRYFFSMNNIIIHRFHKTASMLARAGIRIMLLKGIALLLGGYYQDYSLRPMNDIDIFIEKDDSERVLGLLKENGWKKESDISYFHSVELVKGDGYVLDVHWHLLSQCCWENIDDDLWGFAGKIDFKDIGLYILSPEDQVIQNCAHGIKWNRTPSFRWLIDVVTILDHHKGSIDWDRIVEKARERRLTLTLSESLRFLDPIAGGRIPGRVLDELERIPVDDSERILYTELSRPYGNAGRHWAGHSANTVNRGLCFRVFTFPEYIRSIYGLKNVFAVPGFVIMKIMKRLLGQKKH